MPARILVLTGASSTGKTTVARALQKLAPTPTIFISADDFDLPQDALSLAVLRTANTGAMGALQRAMFSAFYEGIACWPAHGINAIVETIFRDEDQLRVCQTSLANVSYAIVRLVCDFEVRAIRERQRQDRQLGRSEETAQTEVIPHRVDLEINTTNSSPADVATRLLRLLWKDQI